MTEYSPIAAIILAVAITSIVAVNAKTSYNLRLQNLNSMGIAQEEFFYKKNIGRFPHRSMSIENIKYANSFY